MRKQWFMVGIVLLLVPWLAVGCGIAQEQYDDIVAKLSKAQQELQSAKTELETAQSKVSELTSSLEKAESELEEANTELQSTKTELEVSLSKVSELKASLGKAEAAETELANIQSNTFSMMVDNGLARLPNPVTVATNDMTVFPDMSICGVDKIEDASGNAYVRGQDKDGYLLYMHDKYADADVVKVVNYIDAQYTKGTYTVDKYGTVTQVTTGYE